MIPGFTISHANAFLILNRKFLNSPELRGLLRGTYPVVERIYNSKLVGLTLVEFRASDKVHDLVYHCKAPKKEFYDEPIKSFIESEIFPDDAEISVATYSKDRPDESKWFGYQLANPGICLNFRLFNPNYSGGTVKLGSQFLI